MIFEDDILYGYRVKRANRVTRSGPELRRRPSRGTNINPFTPRETQGWGRNGDSRVLNQGEAWVSTPQCIRDESKPQKVLCFVCFTYCTYVCPPYRSWLCERATFLVTERSSMKCVWWDQEALALFTSVSTGLMAASML